MGVLILCLYSGYFIMRGADAAATSPHVGDQLAKFTAAYGQPVRPGTGKGLSVNHANGVTFYADKAQTIIVDARPINGLVTSVSVWGPASWTERQTFQYCTHFVPSGAKAYRSIGRYTYYHSSAGDVVLNNAGHGACQVSITPTHSPA